MTRKRVTASEKKQRHEWAVRQIDAGMGLSELTAVTAETWGCSRCLSEEIEILRLMLCRDEFSTIDPKACKHSGPIISKIEENVKELSSLDNKSAA